MVDLHAVKISSSRARWGKGVSTVVPHIDQGKITNFFKWKLILKKILPGRVIVNIQSLLGIYAPPPMLKMFERQANSLGRKDVEEYIKARQRQRLDVHNEEGALNATGDLFILLFQNGKFGDHDKSMINLAV